MQNNYIFSSIQFSLQMVILFYINNDKDYKRLDFCNNVVSSEEAANPSHVK